MARRGKQLRANDLDGLRILGLGRIPRCADCPRYDQLRRSHRAGGSEQPPIRSALPAVPSHCAFQFCAPLARRYEASARIAPQPALGHTAQVMTA